MITEDIKIVQEIFQLVEAGIVHGYDAFCYGVEWGGNYMEAELAFEKDGFEHWDAETDFNNSKIYMLVEKLHGNAAVRGEPWNSFVLSYRDVNKCERNLVIESDVSQPFHLRSKIAAFGSYYTQSVGAAEGCDLVLFTSDKAAATHSHSPGPARARRRE